MSELKQLLGDYESFVANIDAGLERCGIDRRDLSLMDHICYRVETMERYEEMKTSLAKCAFLLGEAMVTGRLIATFECHEPLEVGKWRIPYIELPQPKEGSPYPEGLEHVEFVVVGSLDRFERQYPDLPYDRKGMSKTINPELGLKHEGISVKFHEQQLGAVVRIEDRLEAKGVKYGG